MSQILKPFILTALILCLSFFIFQEAKAQACANVPLSGDYNVTTSCYFSGTVDGIENGNLIVDSGKTLTINAGQAIVWNPGRTVLIHGAIAINVGSPGGQLRKAYLWLIDADNDDYPSTTTQIASASQPANGKRRKDFTSFTYVTDLTTDTNDSNDCIDTTTHLCCDDTNPTDGPDLKTAGEQGLAACQRCDGASLDAVNITDYNEDSEGSNTCATACQGCSNGSCVNFDDGSKDEVGSNLCTATHYRCDGSGECTAPCSSSKVCICCWDSPHDFALECVNQGYCGCYNCYACANCGGCAARACSPGTYCGAAYCYLWLYD